MVQAQTFLHARHGRYSDRLLTLLAARSDSADALAAAGDDLPTTAVWLLADPSDPAASAAALQALAVPPPSDEVAGAMGAGSLCRCRSSAAVGVSGGGAAAAAFPLWARSASTALRTDS